MNNLSVTPDTPLPIEDALEEWDDLERKRIEVLELSADIASTIRGILIRLEGYIPQREAEQRRPNGVRGWGWRPGIGGWVVERVGGRFPDYSGHIGNASLMRPRIRAGG